MFTLAQLIFAVGTSFLASLLFFWYQRGREKRIDRKIVELRYEEEFLDKIKKGNVELIRSGFKAIAFALGLSFVGMFLLTIKLLLNATPFIENILAVFPMTLFGTAALICFSYFKSLVSLNDVQGAKDKINEKIRKLESQK